MKLLILLIFITFQAQAENPRCETYTGITSTQKICWEKSIKAQVSEACLKNSKCDALKFFKTKNKIKKITIGAGGANPSSLVCKSLKLPVTVLKDAKNNEQSFCVFPDKSVVNSDAIEEHVL